MHNGKSLMQSEITLEQFCFTAFFASSELFSCLSRSATKAKISQGKSLIVKVLKAWDPREARLLSSKEEGAERGGGGARSGRGAGGAGEASAARTCPGGLSGGQRERPLLKQLPAARSVLSDRVKLQGRSNFLPALQSKQKCQYRQHNGAIETGE